MASAALTNEPAKEGCRLSCIPVDFWYQYPNNLWPNLTNYCELIIENECELYILSDIQVDVVIVLQKRQLGRTWLNSYVDASGSKHALDASKF